MKKLLTYYTESGNSLKIANRLSQLNPELEMLELSKVSNIGNYELILLICPVQRFGLPENIKAFIGKINKNSRIAIYASHAMPDMAKELQKVLANIESVVKKENFAGLFHCQGELSEAAAVQMIESGNPQLKGFAAMREHSLNHPTDKELEKACEFTNKLLVNYAE